MTPDTRDHAFIYVIAHDCFYRLSPDSAVLPGHYRVNGSGGVIPGEELLFLPADERWQAEHARVIAQWRMFPGPDKSTRAWHDLFIANLVINPGLRERFVCFGVGEGYTTRELFQAWHRWSPCEIGALFDLFLAAERAWLRR